MSGQNLGCDLYFTDNAVIIAQATASITPPSTANGRLSVAYTQLNTTRKENVVAQESIFIPVFSLCMSRIWGIRRKPKTRLQMRITVSCHIFVIYLFVISGGFINTLRAKVVTCDPSAIFLAKLLKQEGVDSLNFGKKVKIC